MKSLFLLLLLSTSLSFSQTTDYNTKKGFAANGYDVVAYFSNQALEGNNIYKTTYDAVEYKFVSKENLNTFKENPKKFIPQYGGYCAYAIASKAHKVAINPKTFEIKNGKLYLFYNAWGTNTLELWQKENNDTLIEKADKNWEQLKFKK
ncbi:YHS domain-containing (seleno)protein [Thalassobellus suaedae]|uniref:YHS domain-containing (Seleno)protein n=1 Tax=Thalassobellus suaedae TaxID=3074124 RepID=A0ABY9XQZ5_9FLAO|nr:YHS domain-containing (seleno)protein [Flavobacteriaceae bacterium HL-DH14]